MTMNGLRCLKRLVVGPNPMLRSDLFISQNLVRPEDIVQEGVLETLVSQNYDVISEAGWYI